MKKHPIPLFGDDSYKSPGPIDFETIERGAEASSKIGMIPTAFEISYKKVQIIEDYWKSIGYGVWPSEDTHVRYKGYLIIVTEFDLVTRKE